MQENLKKFNDNKIWVTKKTRMESEKNLLEKNRIVNYLLIYYSACLAVMSYLTIAKVGSFNITYISGIISLILPSVNIFQYKADYSRRATEFKECYLSLERLENECNDLILELSDITNIEEALRKKNVIHEKYYEILLKCENQSSIAFFYFKKNEIKRGNKNFSISNGETAKFAISRIIMWMLILLLGILPLAIILIKYYS